MLVAVAKDDGYAFATLCQSKGRNDPVAVQGALRFLLEAGLAGGIRLRSDSELAITGFCQELAARRAPAVTVVETTPVASSSSLGAGERMIQTIVAQVRALRLDVEQRWSTHDVFDDSAVDRAPQRVVVQPLSTVPGRSNAVRTSTAAALQRRDLQLQRTGHGEDAGHQEVAEDGRALGRRSVAGQTA